jgi:hypothetical protein
LSLAAVVDGMNRTQPGLEHEDEPPLAQPQGLQRSGRLPSTNRGRVHALQIGRER